MTRNKKQRRERKREALIMEMQVICENSPSFSFNDLKSLAEAMIFLLEEPNDR